MTSEEHDANDRLLDQLPHKAISNAGNQYTRSPEMVLIFPKVWILLQSTLEVGVPRLYRRQGDKRFIWCRCHLALRHREAGDKVEKVLQYLLTELVVGARRGRRGGLLNKRAFRLDGHADLCNV